jgi:hypothetical protein
MEGYHNQDTNHMSYADPTMLDFMVHARTIWQQESGEIDKTTQTEDCKFREMFGCGLLIAFSVWNIMSKNDLIPEGGSIFHYLWSLMFMKVYARTSVMSTLASADDKTFQKWVWVFIWAIASLETMVVSH